jgi:hypothetical protein
MGTHQDITCPPHTPSDKDMGIATEQLSASIYSLRDNEEAPE